MEDRKENSEGLENELSRAEITRNINKDIQLLLKKLKTEENRSNIFYCDPQAPGKKPHVKNNHNYVRDIIPNGKSLKNLTQEDLNLMFSHINSTPSKGLNGKTPL